MLARHRRAVYVFAVLTLLVTWNVAFSALAQCRPEGHRWPKEARVEFDANAGGILVPVLLDDRVSSMMLNTACSVSGLDTRFRRKLGEPVRQATLRTADGQQEQIELFSAPRASIAGMPIHGVAEVTCIDFSALRSGLAQSIDGVLGMDFLGSQTFRIDFDKGEVAFLKSVPEDAGTPVPLGLTTMGIPTATLVVGGLGRKTMIIATGNPGLSDGEMNSELLGALISNGHAVEVGKSSAVSPFRSVVVRSIQVGDAALAGFRHRHLVFYESEACMLGAGFLSRYVVTFDFPNMKMYLKPGRRFNEPGRYDLSGAVASRRNDRTIVSSVQEGSAAALAGLKVGDAIESLDGRPAMLMPLLEIWRRFCTPGEHALRVTRGAESLHIVLKCEEGHQVVGSD